VGGVFVFWRRGGRDARTKEGGDERNKARDTKQTKQQLYGYRRILFGKVAPGGATLPKKSTATGDTLWATRIVLLSFYKLRLDKHTKHSTFPKPNLHPFFLICP